MNFVKGDRYLKSCHAGLCGRGATRPFPWHVGDSRHLRVFAHQSLYTVHVESRLGFKGLRTCEVATGSGRCAGHLLAGPDSSPVTTFPVDSRVCRSVEFPHAILPTDAFQTVQNVNNDACVQRGTIVPIPFLQSNGSEKWDGN